MARKIDARKIGEEASKAEEARRLSGFTERYLSGPHILDIGYRGYIPDVQPIVPHAIGVELDFPGYDGRTLPFPDNSQDAVFSSHCLEHIPDFVQALRDWFRVAKIGGYLIIMVPHQYLYEKRIALPSRYNADHKRFYTPASLLQDVEAALSPNSYRVRHLADNDAGYEYGIPPERHSGGSYEIELVIEKIAAPGWQLERPAPETHGRAPSPVFAPGEIAPAVTHPPGLPHVETLQSSPWPLRHYSFGRAGPDCRRILALQLGHLGDFVVGMPALRQLRAAFPDSHITVLVGRWNLAQAESCGLVDEVASFDFFPEVARNWDGRIAEDMDAFRGAVPGHFDLAMDLRVDLDTRHLLEHVDADIRAGIAPAGRFPFLDVSLPYDYAQRLRNKLSDEVDVVLGPDRFHSRMPRQGMFRHETDFTVTDTHLIYGPYLRLPAGEYRVSFDVSFRGSGFGRRPARITLEAVQGASDVLASRVLDGATIRRGGAALDLTFTIDDQTAPCEFRVHADGRPIRAVLGFGGIKLQRVGAPPAARLKPADLHVGELMSLLVQLTAERIKPLAILEGAASKTAEPYSPAARATRPLVAIAPASNSDLRDWPADHYATLVRLLVERLDCDILLLGSREQTGVTAHVARESNLANRVTDLAGQTAWTEIPGILHTADLVICNNSGIGHLAAAQGTRTLAIYSASHQPQEWGPRGPNAHAVMAVVPCSPCGLDRLSDCPNGHTCMQDLSPQAVAALAESLLNQPVLAG